MKKEENGVVRNEDASRIENALLYFLAFSPRWWRLDWCGRRTEERNCRFLKTKKGPLKILMLAPDWPSQKLRTKMEINHRFPDDSRRGSSRRKNCWQCKICYLENHSYCYKKINSFSSIYERKFNEIYLWIYILLKQNTGMTVWQIVLQCYMQP